MARRRRTKKPEPVVERNRNVRNDKSRPPVNEVPEAPELPEVPRNKSS